MHRMQFSWCLRLCLMVILVSVYLITTPLITTGTLGHGSGLFNLSSTSNYSSVLTLDRNVSGSQLPEINWCRPLGYQATISHRKSPNSVIALASFPGSGNTWLRYLLQQSTGIITGSIYKDQALLKNGYPGRFCYY